MPRIDVIIASKCSSQELIQFEEHCKSMSYVHKVIAFAADDLCSTNMLKAALSQIEADYVLVLDSGLQVQFGANLFERMEQVARMADASMVYADYFEEKGEAKKLYRLTDYQVGSIRNDFNFGPAKLYSAKTLLSWSAWEATNYKYAALYSLRLYASRIGNIFHLPEPLCVKKEDDQRKSGEKQFDYVREEVAAQQKEMELACTRHLKEIGAYVSPPFKRVVLNGIFPVEVTVVIPVKNRAKTIGEAIKSVLSQNTNFAFNLIVVDNYSTDGTTDIVKQFATDERLIHQRPKRVDLGIGGCWNEALHHPQCGKFLVQLDSDDLYLDSSTLQKIADVFYREKCAMVIGSYQMVDFDLNPLPPGVVDHKEWTADNGPNNALRINGLGAPRAFFTPVLKEIGIPNVSYGEDYALGIALSAVYHIGRIFEPIYLCRRWEGNSDAALSNELVNAHNHYKDALRSIEIISRQKRHKGE